MFEVVLVPVVVGTAASGGSGCGCGCVIILALLLLCFLCVFGPTMFPTDAVSSIISAARSIMV